MGCIALYGSYPFLKKAMKKEDETKSILIVRHGKFLNPGGVVYNRDSVMKKSDWVHVSPEGIIQMMALGKLIKEKGFRTQYLWTSPSVRAKESAEALNRVLQVDNFRVVEDLDDVYCPGPYRMGMTMVELETLGGDVYGGMYGEVESPEDVAARLSRVYWRMADLLTPGETGILVTHGDSSAWLIRKLVFGSLPEPKHLRDDFYLPKAGAYVTVIGSKKNLIHSFYLTDPRGEIY